MSPDQEHRLEEIFSAACDLPPRERRAVADKAAPCRPGGRTRSAAARLCDEPDGPTAVGYGGARGGGKSHWLLAQMGADDCQRVRGLKCLLLARSARRTWRTSRTCGGVCSEAETRVQRVSRAADVWQRLAHHRRPFPGGEGHRRLPRPGIRRDRHRGSHDAVEPQAPGHHDLLPHVEAELASAHLLDVQPGRIGHAWYRAKFVLPFLEQRETDTRFVPARVTDNRYCNAEYVKVLENLSGWQKRAWFDGDWDIAAGQFFTTFRRDVHVIEDFDDTRAVEWLAALDYGFAHYTVILLACRDGDGNVFIVDEHAQRLWLPQRHANAFDAMLSRHNLRVGT